MKYNLVGIDGNAFSVMWYVREAMRKEGYSIEERKAYTDDATSGDYNHLLVVSIDMINKLNEKYSDVEDEDEIEEYGFTDSYFDLE